MPIQLNYDPQTNTLQQKDLSPVQRGSSFSFSSNIEGIETQFKNDSPDERDLPPQRRDGTHTYLASKPGRFKFDCFINGQLTDGGGELEVLPGMSS